jgi:hypothetical protein
LSLSAEAWFWRVLMAVDDFGNGEGDPDLCRYATAGHRKVTSKDVARWLGEMWAVKLIQFYQVKGELFIHVVGFEETQPAGKNGRRIRRFPAPEESGGILNNPDVVSASYSEEEDDPDSDTEKVARTAKPRSPSTVDDDFLNDLQAKEAYQKLNVKQVYAKMTAWCEIRQKQPTRMRLINWLNREDQPMENGNGTNKPAGYQTASERRSTSFRERLAVVEELRGEGVGAADEDVRWEPINARR